MSLRAWTIGIALIAGIAVAAEEHGKSDVFFTDGAALAWAVERGPDESRTFVVIRVRHDVGIIRSFTAIGRDPFTKAEHAWKVVPIASGRADVRIPRAQIGDFPHTVLRFHSGTPGGAPRLEVVYHGVPDTAPEFDDRARLEKYLEERIR